jgi:hypothetical protein
MITKFPLKGLSIGNRCTIDTLDGSGWFHAPTNFEKDKFEALFEFCKKDWVNKKIAIVQHDGFRVSGIPINPIVIGVEYDERQR